MNLRSSFKTAFSFSKLAEISSAEKDTQLKKLTQWKTHGLKCSCLWEGLNLPTTNDLTWQCTSETQFKRTRINKTACKLEMSNAFSLQCSPMQKASFNLVRVPTNRPTNQEGGLGPSRERQCQSESQRIKRDLPVTRDNHSRTNSIRDLAAVPHQSLFSSFFPWFPDFSSSDVFVHTKFFCPKDCLQIELPWRKEIWKGIFTSAAGLNADQVWCLCGNSKQDGLCFDLMGWRQRGRVIPRCFTSAESQHWEKKETFRCHFSLGFVTDLGGDPSPGFPLQGKGDPKMATNQPSTAITADCCQLCIMNVNLLSEPRGILNPRLFHKNISMIAHPHHEQKQILNN